MFQKILDWIKSNRAATIAAVAALAIVIPAITGCELGDHIKHDVPKDMQVDNGNQPKVSLNDAERVLEDYIKRVERNVGDFVAANEKAHVWFDAINSILTVSMNELGAVAFPGAGILLPSLMAFGGLMIRKPGTAKAIADEKMASYNKGHDTAIAAVKDLVTPDKFQAILDAIKADSEKETEVAA